MRKALKYLENNSFFENGREMVDFDVAIKAIKIALEEQITEGQKTLEQQKPLYVSNTN